MDLNKFKELPILGILRGIDEGMVDPIIEIAHSTGLQTLEITMNTAHAAACIRRMVETAAGRVTVGAGTVLTLSDFHAALDAGASFIVLPTLVQEVVEECVRRSVPVFPGALTPDEIYRAWRAGAAMVKVFPAKFFGPAYFSEIKGPFKDLELLACGGINAETIVPYFAHGASAVAFGGSIFKPEWLKAENYTWIQESLRTLIRRYLEWKGDR